MKILLLISSFLLFFCTSNIVQAYPNFVGFGYRSCLVCHENGSGGGALTDYGRGVFASEIAANPISGQLSDEEQAEVSNFLGKTEFPYWVRVGIKYRALTVERNPGSDQAQKYYYNMQNDLNLNLFANEAHSLGVISTLGYAESANAISPNKPMNSTGLIFWREYYLRAQATKEFWFYLGFMDKVFGIKTANHTAYNRSPLLLGQNNQVHAALMQWARKDQDLFLQYWMGNAHTPQADRMSGGSVMLDRKWGDSHAYGFGVLTEKGEDLQQSIGEIHNKMGFGDGNALLMELGYQNTKSDLGGEVKNPYLFTENTLNLTKGVFLLSSLQVSNPVTELQNTTRMRWDIGFLVFPIQRMEFRISTVNDKSSNNEEDQWSTQSQIHLSL
jgi:hypothetical protein